MRLGLCALGFAALAAGAALADEGPPTITATRETTTFYVEAPGVLDAKDPVEVAVKPLVFQEELEVETAFLGGPVEKDAPLVTFKTDKIDDALKAAERDLAIAKAALAVQTEEQTRKQEISSIALAKAELDAKNAALAAERFEKFDMPLRIEESENGLQGTRNWVADQAEELAQLEKMYKHDDVVEETEDIVLKRTRRDLERGKRNLDFQTRRDAALREVDLPKQLESLRLEARRVGAERDRTVAVARLQQEQSSLELDRTRANVEQQEKKLEKLKADRSRFTLTAPVAGFAAPGALLRGRWAGADDVRRALRTHGKIKHSEVVFTIVQPVVARVQAVVGEAFVLGVKAGAEARVVPQAAPDLSLAAKVAWVAPTAQGGDYEIALDLVEPETRLLPGYACKVRIATGTRPAILLPAAAVADGFERSVQVVVDGKPQRRVVSVGAAKDGKLEIVAGLAEGERVVEPAKK